MDYIFFPTTELEDAQYPSYNSFYPYQFECHLGIKIDGWLLEEGVRRQNYISVISTLAQFFRDEMLEWASLNTSCWYQTPCHVGINLCVTEMLGVFSIRWKWYHFVDFLNFEMYIVQHGGFSRGMVITPQGGSSWWQSSPWAGEGGGNKGK